MEEVTSNKETSRHTFWSLQQLQFAEKELSEIINLSSNQKLKGKKGETEDNKTKLQNWSNNTLSDNKITRLKQLNNSWFAFELHKFSYRECLQNLP